MNRPPNLLLIVVDQQRADCLGYSAAYPVCTPRIDQLASEGIFFSEAYTHIPLCSPARQSFLNGRRPETFGGLWNYNNGLKIGALEPTEYAWPRELKRLGYRTRQIGKWGVHPNFDPTLYGYDQFVGEERYQHFKRGKYPDLVYNPSYFGERDEAPLADSRTHWLAGQVNDMIRECTASGDPWHIRLDFPEPHLPCRPAGQFADMYNPADVPEWRSFGEKFVNKPYIQRQQLYNWGVEKYTWEDWAPIVARYYGVISQVDDAIGRVLDTLDELEIADDTIVIYTADHGDLCGGHRMMDKHYVLYDDVVKVPLVVRWPKQIRPGQRCEQLVYNLLDLPPTILEWLGLQTEAVFHGKSLVPLLKGEAVSPLRDAVVATYNGQQFGLYTQRMIRTKQLKYIWNTTDVDELYDLESDPDELVNAIYDPSYAAAVQSLRERLYGQLLQDGDGLASNDWMKGQLLAGRKQ